MLTIPYRVARGGFEWVGLELSFKPDYSGGFCSYGRIGTTANPLQYSPLGVFGGWYFEGVSFRLMEDTTKIDLVADIERGLSLLTRSEDDLMSSSQRILVPLARRDYQEWSVYLPTYT